MAFVSLPFLIFVAITTVVYFLVPKKFRWIVLLAASYVFFWLNSEWLILVMFATTLVTFFAGIIVYRINQKGKEYLSQHPELTKEEKKQQKARMKKKANAATLISVLIVLGILLFLKYFDFFSGNANLLLKHFGVTIPALNLLLPLGISFYTMQAMAYIIDISRNKYEPDRNLAKFMLFMSFFPQIVQGPIARHNQLAHQLYEGHDFDYHRLAMGAQLIIWGWMKKVIIADRIAIPTDYIFNNYSELHGLVIFLGAAFYGIQVYADFSGGMDIARGVSQIFGIELELNFIQPYFSTSVEDFWRRWHKTLGAWMRDYIFYPLSLSKLFGNLGRITRKIFGDFMGKRIPAFVSMFIVYFLVGFWHGAEWKYIVYGIWNGIFIMLGILLPEFYEFAKNKCGIRSETVTWHIFQMFRTFVIISLGRFFSRGDSVHAVIAMVKCMCTKILDLSFLVDGTMTNLGLDTPNWNFLSISILVLLFVDYLHEKNVHIRETIAGQSLVFRWVIYIGAIAVILIFGVYGPAYDSVGFIYEQF